MVKFNCLYCNNTFEFEEDNMYDSEGYVYHTSEPKCSCGETKQLKLIKKEDLIDLYDDAPLSKRKGRQL